MKINKWKQTLLATLIGCSMVSSASSQINDATDVNDTLTLQNCLDIGLINNYSLRIAKNQQQISGNNATLGNAGYLPTVDLRGSYRGTVDTTNTTLRSTGEVTSEHNVFVHTLIDGITLNCIIVPVFNSTMNEPKLNE